MKFWVISSLRDIRILNLCQKILRVNHRPLRPVHFVHYTLGIGFLFAFYTEACINWSQMAQEALMDNAINGHVENCSGVKQTFYCLNGGSCHKRKMGDDYVEYCDCPSDRFGPRCEFNAPQSVMEKYGDCLPIILGIVALVIMVVVTIILVYVYCVRVGRLNSVLSPVGHKMKLWMQSLNCRKTTTVPEDRANNI